MLGRKKYIPREKKQHQFICCFFATPPQGAHHGEMGSVRISLARRDLSRPLQWMAMDHHTQGGVKQYLKYLEYQDIALMNQISVISK